MCFYGSLSGFSPFLGEPVQIALTLDIASISSISESNMVSVAPLSSTQGAPFLVFYGDIPSSYSKQNRESLRMAEAGDLS